jgi:preprotein translocase subunit SecG
LYYLLITLYIIACFILILFVLLQPGKSDAAAVFGGGANSSAFGPRGTQSVMAKVTIGAAIVFFSIAFVFAIPGLFTQKSLGEGVGPAEVQPITPESQSIPTPAPDQPPATAPAATPAAPTTPPAGNPPPQGNSATPDPKGAAKPADNKKPDAKPPTEKKP